MNTILRIAGKGFMRTLSVAGLASMSFCLMPTAQAALIGTTPITPGATVFPTQIPNGTAVGTLLASLTDPYTFTTTSGTTTGTLYTAVYRESGGTLDFYYQVQGGPNAATGIAREVNTNFFGPYTLAVGYRTDNATVGGPFLAPTSPVLAPQTADMSSGTTGVVGFTFAPPDTNRIFANQVSPILVISTSATAYTNGNDSVIDGGTPGNLAAFQPVQSTIPEPASFAFLGLGLVAFGAFKRFRKA